MTQRGGVLEGLAHIAAVLHAIHSWVISVSNRSVSGALRGASQLRPTRSSRRPTRRHDRSHRRSSIAAFHEVVVVVCSVAIFSGEW
jgi:hypothetical protein